MKKKYYILTLESGREKRILVLKTPVYVAFMKGDSSRYMKTLEEIEHSEFERCEKDTSARTLYDTELGNYIIGETEMFAAMRSIRDDIESLSVIVE